MNKQEAFEKWVELNNIHWTPDLIQDIENRWHNVIVEMHRQFIGKKQSDYNKAYKKLVSNGYENELAETIKPFQAEVSKVYEKQKERKEVLELELRAFAEKSSPETTKDMNFLKLSQSNSYHTQPSHNKYAREALAEDIKLLEILGFETEIKKVNCHTSEGFYPSYYEDYELWSNLTLFDFEMLKMSGEFISVLNWAVLCWKKGTNPKVYFQFLSDDDYEKSQVLAYQCQYEVTRDNMKLELSWDEINKIRKS